MMIEENENPESEKEVVSTTEDVQATEEEVPKEVEEPREMEEPPQETLEEPQKAEEEPQETVEEPQEAVEEPQEATGELQEQAPEVEEIVQAETTASLPEEEIPPPPAFDWDAESGETEGGYSKAERAELEDMYNKTLKPVQQGDLIDGVIVSMNKKEVVIDLGYKCDGIINANEFRYAPDLKSGDPVKVYIEALEDAKGNLVLSHKKARIQDSWKKINTFHETGDILQGYVKCRTKGGMIVDVLGLEAFLPGSQIDVRPIMDYDEYVGKTMEFKVVKINHEFRNVVVSHKALIESELEEQRREIMGKLEVGQVLEGVVKNITPYGVFVDLGGIDGLIHITDLSWGRVSHPSEIVELDSTINVVILDFDDEKQRIALGVKQLTPHPWDALDENLKEGDKVKGRVTVLADYGAFVEVNEGVEGLVHVSEMSWSQHLRSAQDFVKVGDEIETVILALDRDDRKMSLGIKQLTTDPWEDIEKQYPVDSKHMSTVRSFTNFGIFVELEEGVDGLVHISDLSWTKKVKHPSEFTTLGSPMEVVVLETSQEARRVNLGHKQLEENPWDVFEQMFEVGSIHEGVVIEIKDKGVIIQLPEGIEGFATPKHMTKEDGTKPKLDEKLPFKIIEFSKNSKRIIVSHARVWEDEKKGKTQKTSPLPKQKIEKTTLGDVTGLKDLKANMQEEKKE